MAALSQLPRIEHLDVSGKINSVISTESSATENLQQLSHFTRLHPEKSTAVCSLGIYHRARQAELHG